MKVWSVIAVVALTGCSAMQNVRYATENSTQYAAGNSSYKMGFENGCHSRVSEAREWMNFPGDAFIRDDERMKSDNDYALGWTDGMRRCGGSGGAAVPIVVPVRR